MREETDNQVRRRGYISTGLAVGGVLLAGIAYHNLMKEIAKRSPSQEEINRPILAYHSDLDGDEIPDLVLRTREGKSIGLIGMANGTYVLDENPLGVENYMTHVPGLIELPKFKKREEKWMREDNLEGIFGQSPLEGF